MLKEILEKHAELAARYNIRGMKIPLEALVPGDYSTERLKNRCTVLTYMHTDYSVEFAELLNRLPFKHWKNYPDITTLSQEDIDEIYFEVVDMFHFLFTMLLTMGLDAETFYNYYMSKLEENHNRQDRGY